MRPISNIPTTNFIEDGKTLKMFSLKLGTRKVIYTFHYSLKEFLKSWLEQQGERKNQNDTNR